MSRSSDDKAKYESYRNESRGETWNEPEKKTQKQTKKKKKKTASETSHMKENTPELNATSSAADGANQAHLEEMIHETEQDKHDGNTICHEEMLQKTTTTTTTTKKTEQINHSGDFYNYRRIRVWASNTSQ